MFVNMGVSCNCVDSLNEVFMGKDKFVVFLLRSLFFGYLNIVGVIFEGYEVMNLGDDYFFNGRKSSGINLFLWKELVG